MTSAPSNVASVLRFKLFDGLPVIHGVTTRHASLPGDGDINVAGRLPREEAIHNREIWSDEIGVVASAIVTGRQVHGSQVRLVDRSHAGSGATAIEEALPATDGLVTREVGLPLMVYTADCVPAVVYDPVEHVLGVAHAGWRGTVANVAGELIATMQREFGSAPRHLVAGIGPSIGPCCYEVGNEVIDAWRLLGLDKRGQAVRRQGSSLHFDLWRANALAFELMGIPPDRVELAGICTKCCSDRFFSRRAGNGHRGLFGTMAALARVDSATGSVSESEQNA